MEVTKMADPIFCQTIGLEIEVTDVNTHNLRLPGGWRVTSDASVEQDIVTINGIPAVNHTEVQTLNLGSNVHGGEILTSILDTQQNYLGNVKFLCSELIRRGEPYQSERAGLHVHLSFTRPHLDILKAIMRLGCHLEDVFFLVGGMGYEFRGGANDCSYCRPITTPGPQVIHDGAGRLYPCFVVDDLLKAESVNDFQTRLGDYTNLRGSKYIPIRYHWLNLFNMWNKKQTLEFRVFNRSLKPRYIEGAVELCRAFGNAVMYYAYNKDELNELEFNSVYDCRNKEDILNTFLSFAGSRIESNVIDTLLRMMNDTPIESIRFPKQAFWFHLRFHRNGSRSPEHWYSSGYRPSIKYSKSEVKQPKFMDIHNMRAGGVRNMPEPILDEEEDNGLWDHPIDFEEIELTDTPSQPSIGRVTPSDAMNSLGEQVRQFNASLQDSVVELPEDETPEDEEETLTWNTSINETPLGQWITTEESDDELDEDE
jgi:hypothetical protein